MSQLLSVRAPKFDLYEFVTLSWNDQTLQGKVVKRWLDLDESLWLYQLVGVGSDRLEAQVEALSHQPQLALLDVV